MESFAVQRIYDGEYVSPRWQDHHVKDPKLAYLFVSREAARQYILREELLGYTVARFPATRPLL